MIMTDKQTTKPQFIWHKIDSELRIKKSSHYIKVPLKSSVNLTLKDSVKQDTQTRLHIDIQKSLQYQDSIGWNWHKSSNLPIFSIKLTVFNSTHENYLLPPPNLQANIYAVKIVQNTFQKEENLYLQNIGIKGQNHIQLKEGCGYFNGLKFCSTSYNNQGVKFHLLIVIFKNDDQSQIPKNIICSVISPPIFVDSRKSARNYQEKKYLSFVELFNPNQLDKFFAKRDNKQFVEQKKIISNNGEGLYNYLTAPNIRHKVKHPLFLSVRFSNAFKIFFNSQSKYFSIKGISLTCIINRLQKKLIKEVGLLKRNKNSQSIQQKQFAIVLNIDQLAQKQKMLQMLQYLDCHSICLLDKTEILNNQFINIQQLGDITEIYKTQYFSLKKKSEREISQLKVKRIKNQDEQNLYLKEQQINKQTLYQKILYKEEQKFSASQRSQPELQNLDQKKQSRNESIRSLGMSLKKIKLNNNEFFTRNSQLFRYPLHEQLEQRFIEQRLQLEKYQNNPYNFNENYQCQLVKRQQNGMNIIYISRQVIQQKIKEMCLQVYQRNKKSILNHLETLKKSNIKWKVRDVQQFIFSYSSALMDAIHFRQRLLHHMFLQNEILKAKVGVMQQMALTDLDKIKGNIMAMNKFLPEKFILEKLKQNQLWNEEIDNEAQIFKVAKIKQIEVKQEQKSLRSVEIQQNDGNVDKMIDQISSSQVDGQLQCECNFVSNVFELSSPSIRQ